MRYVEFDGGRRIAVRFDQDVTEIFEAHGTNPDGAAFTTRYATTQPDHAFTLVLLLIADYTGRASGEVTPSMLADLFETSIADAFEGIESNGYYFREVEEIPGYVLNDQGMGFREGAGLFGSEPDPLDWDSVEKVEDRTDEIVAALFG